MSTIVEEAERLISRMNPVERAQVREKLNNETNGQFPGIESTPGVCGGDARVAGHRIPVWVLWGYHELGMSDERLLESYPTITAQDLHNAFAYARAHMDEIQEAIRDNESNDDESDA